MSSYPTCEECGRANRYCKERIDFDGKTLCWMCYKLYRNHPYLYIPPKGEIHYDKDKRIICHECGRAFDSLSHHISGKHKMNTKLYKKKHGLNSTQSLSSEKAKKEFAKSVNIKNLDKYRIPFKKGHTVTKGRVLSLQGKKNRTGVKYKKRIKEGDTND